MVMEKTAKRLYSLAYNRASAALKNRYPEEFETLLKAYQANLAFELTQTGSIDGFKSVPLHVAGEDGLCARCGNVSPCKQQRAREAKALARDRIATTVSAAGAE